MTEYIIKSSVAVATAYILYFSLLRNHSRFKWVRTYFYVSVIAALILPAFSYYFAARNQVWVQIPSEYIREFLRDDAVGNPIQPIVTGNSFFTKVSFYTNLIYLGGLAFVLIRFLTGLIKLLYFIFKFGTQKINGNNLVIMQDLPYPFSFLHLIFINRQTLADDNSEAILLHERAHVRQWHSLDIILLEFLAAFQWFNPFVWLYRRSVKDLHEFLADEAVIRSQKSSLDYQLLVFRQASGMNLTWPINGFSSSITKKRIFMISNKKNKKWYAVAAVMVVAIFAIQSLTRVNLAQDPPHKKGAVKQQGDTTKWTYPPPPPPPPPLPPSNVPKVKMADHGISNSTKMDDMPVPPPPPPPPFPLFSGTNDFKDSNAAFGEFINKNFSIPEEYKNKKANIFLLVFFDKNGKIKTAMTVPKTEGFPTEGLEVISEEQSDKAESIVDDLVSKLRKAPPFNLLIIPSDLYFVEYSFLFDRGVCRVLPLGINNTTIVK